MAVPEWCKVGTKRVKVLFYEGKKTLTIFIKDNGVMGFLQLDILYIPYKNSIR